MPIPAGGDDTLPDWAPNLEQVADYTTARTLIPQTNGSLTEIFGFTNTTRPTADQATRIRDGAVNWLLASTGTLDASLSGAAATCCAIRAAGLIELRFPERQSANREDAIKTAEDLLKQADNMLKQLAARNEALTGEDPDDPAGVFGVLPMWSFPPAPCPEYF